jgi:hypothetical protein
LTSCFSSHLASVMPMARRAPSRAGGEPAAPAVWCLRRAKCKRAKGGGELCALRCCGGDAGLSSERRQGCPEAGQRLPTCCPVLPREICCWRQPLMALAACFIGILARREGRSGAWRSGGAIGKMASPSMVRCLRRRHGFGMALPGRGDSALSRGLGSRCLQRGPTRAALLSGPCAQPQRVAMAGAKGTHGTVAAARGVRAAGKRWDLPRRHGFLCEGDGLQVLA